ncbi:two-component response regulator-like PRR37 isoform X2 [Curcuma longa]|uniref:two-component response regulator-like PRR37 isoform X2 n=1 Tax=Curcuma longa TaxID=136217 RepID=UPI003D9EACA0
MKTIHLGSPNEEEERSQHILYEHKEVMTGIFIEGKGMPEHDDSRNNVAFEDPKLRESLSPLAHQGALQEKPEQPPDPIVRWERFLPVRALKVLLVENDDSTRQVVGALLRNCSYEVRAGANGLQAWKIIEDLSNHVDLVLTEVFMPGLCGVTLLSKIISHKARKNIPVIMMSSNDSMGTAFKCLTKGAVDFLVKPIRKNELKNLWQHIWRRFHSSSGRGSGSGSGSESGIETQKSAKSRNLDDSENNIGSNDENNRCNSLNARDGSDNDSGTQVIHPNPETFCNDWVPISSNGECQGQKEHTDEIMGKDLKIGIPSNAEIQYETHPIEKHLSKQRDWDMNKDKMKRDQNNNGIPTLESNNLSTSDERNTKASDLISSIANNTSTQPLSALQVPYDSSKISECQEKTTDNSREIPNLELSLKRHRPMGEFGSATHDDRNVLRCSEQSAFSRYHKSAAHNQAPTGCGGSCSPPDNSSEARKEESTYNMISSSNAGPLKQGSNGSCNNNEMCTATRKNSINNVTTSSNAAALKPGSAACSNKNTMGSTTNIFTKSEANKEETAFNYIRTTAVLHPKQILTSTNQQIVHEKVQHHHHHHHHHHLHVHNMLQQQQSPDPDDLPPNMAAPASQCWSSNALIEPFEETSRLGVGYANGSGSSRVVVQMCFAQREAALKKFREKRKERNFVKKVRYQSRKILAEQRPRVRGQFVRQ